HLAGALGRPVWVALKYVPDWRWLLDREDSPWYPSARLFRQDRDGDWTGVFARMEGELSSLEDKSFEAKPARSRQSIARPESSNMQEQDPKQPLFANANLRIKPCKHGAMMYYVNDSYIGRSLDLYGEFSEGEMDLLGQVL